MNDRLFPDDRPVPLGGDPLMSGKYPDPVKGKRETSREAAESLDPDRVETQRDRVWRFILSRGWHGAMDQEIRDELKIEQSSLSPRRAELIKAGDVVESGRHRKTRSNRKSIVWIAARFASKGGAE